MKLSELKKEPKLILAQFFMHMADDEIETLPDLAKRFGMSRNRVSDYVVSHKIPKVKWCNKTYVGGKKALREFKKLVEVA